MALAQVAVIPMKRVLDGVKAVTYRPLIDILKDLERDFVKETVSGEHFSERFYPSCKDEKIAEFLKSL